MTRAGALTIARNATTGRPTQTTTGSITETYSFSDLGELSSSVVTCGGTTLRAISLARDTAGQITAQDETVLGQTDSITYDHDSRGWLTGVHHGVVSSTYTYDSNGNRLSASRPELVSYVYDAQDRLVQQGGTTYLYTASGQLKSKTEPSGTTSYHYDLFGNLRSAQLADGRSVSYVIDGMNRRIGKQVDGAIIQGLLYGAAGLVIAELDGSGAVVSRFVYGIRSSVPDYMIKGGVTYRILSDIVGSPRLMPWAPSKATSAIRFARWTSRKRTYVARSMFRAI
jgi:YD repeat-containing protein